MGGDSSSLSKLGWNKLVSFFTTVTTVCSVEKREQRKNILTSGMHNTGLKKALPFTLAQVDFLAAQVTFRVHLPNWQGKNKIIKGDVTRNDSQRRF